MTIQASQVVATIGAPLTLTTTHGTIAAALGTPVAAASGSVIVVHDIQLQLVAGTAATTCYLQSGTVPVRSIYMASVGDGLLFAATGQRDPLDCRAADGVEQRGRHCGARPARTTYEGA